MEPQATSQHSVLYRFTIITILLIVIVATAFFIVKNFKQAPDQSSVPQDMLTEDPQVTESEPQTPEGAVRPDGTTVISGTIVEILTKPDMTDKWITVLHVDELGNTLEYKFFISADSVVTAPIEGGQKVTLTFIGSPSTVDFVLAKAIEAATN